MRKKWWVVDPEFGVRSFDTKKEVEEKVFQVLGLTDDVSGIEIFYGEKLNFEHLGWKGYREAGVRVDNAKCNC